MLLSQTMALSDEADHETTESENRNNDDSQSQSQSEDDDESTESEYQSASDSDTHSNSNHENQLTEEQQQKLMKQKQMVKAHRDLENIHSKLCKIIEDKLSKNGGGNGIIDVLQEQPSIINEETGYLRSYQLDGLNWLIRVQQSGLNAILADEMGLGKTLQCISLLAYNMEYKSINGPHLIIVPKSTMYNWRNEFIRWCPSFRIFLLDGDKIERKQLINDYILSVLDINNLEFDICITSYEQCNIECKYLKKIKWHYIVIDEAHRMKNENAKLSKTCRSLSSFHRLLITGTPLQNNLHELWSLLNFLIPQAFINADSFDILYEAQQQENIDNNNIDLINNMLLSIHKLLRPLILRRLKYEVEKSLPPKTEMILYVGMSKVQIALYKSLLSRNIDVLRDTISSKKTLLNISMQLKKVCNHPYLFDGVEDRSLSIYGEHIINNSAKLCMLNKLLPSLKEDGSKCLIFCQMTRMLDILDDYCSIRGYNRCRIDGNTIGSDRESQIDDFNNINSNKFIFLLSTRAGGLGINLVAADCVILYDSDWNPMMDLQAQDRAHRIGQNKCVKIFRLITKNSIEEKILQRAQLKLNLDELIIQKVAKENNNNNKNISPSKQEVSSMIKYGIEEIIKLKDDDNTIKEMNEMSIEEILNKGKEASLHLNKLMTKHAKNRFSIKSSDYSLLEDCKLDNDVFRTLEKIKKQNNNTFDNEIKGKKVGGRTTNNSNNGYNIKFDEMDNLDKKIKAINSKKQEKERINDLKAPDKIPRMQYFQFFNDELLIPLFEKEWFFYNKYKNLEQDIIENIKNWERYGLTEYEYKLKYELLNESFSDWNYKHFCAFIKSCTDYGRENIDMICKALPIKTRDEIIRYSHRFFENKRNNKEINKKINDIICGENTIERYLKYKQLLNKKLKSYKCPMEEMEFPSAPYDSRCHGFRVEHDRFIIKKTTEIGYGDWNKLRLEILNSKQFKFDFFMQSRSNNDINKRMRQLRPSIEKEFKEHIRIFDRIKNEKNILKKKKYQENRLKNHLKYLQKQKQKIIDRKQDINDNHEPPKKRRKLNNDNNDELPTPPPVLTLSQSVDGNQQQQQEWIVNNDNNAINLTSTPLY